MKLGEMGAVKGIKRGMGGIKKLGGSGVPSYNERLATRMAGTPEMPNDPGQRPFKKGGSVKHMSGGGSASARADGVATKGKTKGSFV
jgi:hypothetical protein